jgi:uncharacterized protein (DUF2141 family)
MNRFVTTTLLAFAFAFGSSVLSSGEASADGVPDGRVMVDIYGLRNAKGVVRCTLFSSANGFPSQPDRAAMKTTSPAIVNGRAACAFDDVKPGVYAVGFLHDENANGKMDTNFLGIPTEGYGASNDARGKMGPPKWEDAKFTHQGKTSMRLKTEY